MKTKLFLAMASLIYSLFAVYWVSGDESTYPNYPWFTYGNVSKYYGGKEDPGLKFDGYLEQGVDWFRIGRTMPIVNTFLGLQGTFSNREERWWDNMWGPSIGLRLKFPLNISERSGGTISIGVREEYFLYVSDERPYNDEWRTVIFLQWYMGGNLK